MNDDMTLDEHDGLGDVPMAKTRSDDDGIVVEEPIDLEAIELGGRSSTLSERMGWETARDDGRDPPALLSDDSLPSFEGLREELPDAAAGLVAQLEEEHLRLAAELASLRRDAAARERSLEQEIESLQSRLADRETELSEQVAQIASLTLACDGLRVNQKEQSATETELRRVASAASLHGGNESEQTVASLKARLEERGRALKVAREAVTALQHERAKLVDALAERGEQVAQLLAQVTRAEVRHGFGMDFRSGLRRLFRRDPTTGTGEDGAPAWSPAASDEPTIASDDTAGSLMPAETPAATARLADQGQLPSLPLEERERILDRAVHRARRRRRRPGAALRRYLISLEPDVSEVFELSRPRSYVGRGAEADLRIGDATVSRLHGVVYLVGGATMVEDACSTNGVFVNRQRVHQAVLKDGDTVTFGSARFQFRVGPPPSEADG